MATRSRALTCSKILAPRKSRIRITSNPNRVTTGSVVIRSAKDDAPDVLPLGVAEAGSIASTWSSAEAAEARHQVGRQFHHHAEAVEDGVVAEAEAETQIGADARQHDGVDLSVHAKIVHGAARDHVLGAQRDAGRGDDGLAVERVDLPITQGEIRAVGPIDGAAEGEEVRALGDRVHPAAAEE